MKLWAHIIGWLLLVMIIMVGAAYLWVWIYATFINSTGDQAFYEAYAQTASPIVAIVTALPVFYLMGRSMRRFEDKAMFAAMAVLGLNVGVVKAGPSSAMGSLGSLGAPML